MALASVSYSQYEKDIYSGRIIMKSLKNKALSFLLLICLASFSCPEDTTNIGYLG